MRLVASVLIVFVMLWQGLTGAAHAGVSPAGAPLAERAVHCPHADRPADRGIGGKTDADRHAALPMLCCLAPLPASDPDAAVLRPLESGAAYGLASDRVPAALLFGPEPPPPRA